MNYIWELAIKAKEQEIDEDLINFKYGKPFSPYMELSFVDMNETNVLFEVEINPFYRYYRIFKDLFEPNVIENEEIIEALLDINIHHLKNIDILMGMNRKEYHINFVIKDMLSGYFGSYVCEKIALFTRPEQKVIGNNILNLYNTGECIYLLKDTVIRIFTSSYIFSNASEKDEIIFFLRTKQTKEKQEKLDLIKYLFTPFKCGIEVYWEYIFGVFGVDELMKIDSIMNY